MCWTSPICPRMPDSPTWSSACATAQLTDKIVGDSFATMTRDDLLKRLAEADIAFAEVNTMADLAVHPHLRRIEVDTPNGKVSYAAPAAIFMGEPRHYGAVPAIGERPSETAKRSPKPAQRSKKPASIMTSHDRSHRSRSLAAMDRPQRGKNRHRNRASGGGIALGAVPRCRQPEAGDAAPFTAHWCLTLPVVALSEVSADGHPNRGGFLPPVPLPRRMWAGGAINFVEPLRVGDTVTRASTSRI